RAGRDNQSSERVGEGLVVRAAVAVCGVAGDDVVAVIGDVELGVSGEAGGSGRGQGSVAGVVDRDRLVELGCFDGDGDRAGVWPGLRIAGAYPNEGQTTAGGPLVGGVGGGGLWESPGRPVRVEYPVAVDEEECEGGEETELLGVADVLGGVDPAGQEVLDGVGGGGVRVGLGERAGRDRGGDAA